MTGSMPSEPDERARQFFTAAEPLLLRYGFRKTTVEEICRATGASKRTFYELFRDKCDLLGQMLLYLASEALEEWRRGIDPAASALTKIESYLDGYEAFARRHPVFQQSIHEADLRSCGPGVVLQAKMRTVLDALAEIIGEGVSRNELRPADPRIMARIVDGLLDAMYYVYPDLTGEKSALENRALARELRAFILDGLRSPDAPQSRRE